MIHTNTKPHNFIFPLNPFLRIMRATLRLLAHMHGTGVATGSHGVNAQLFLLASRVERLTEQMRLMTIRLKELESKQDNVADKNKTTGAHPGVFRMAKEATSTTTSCR